MFSSHRTKLCEENGDGFPELLLVAHLVEVAVSPNDPNQLHVAGCSQHEVEERRQDEILKEALEIG